VHGVGLPQTAVDDELDGVHAHPLRNDATMVVPHASLERFLEATGHPPRILDVDDNEPGSPAAGDAARKER